jgi:hypothetical protein
VANSELLEFVYGKRQELRALRNRMLHSTNAAHAMVSLYRLCLHAFSVQHLQA